MNRAEAKKLKVGDEVLVKDGTSSLSKEGVGVVESTDLVVVTPETTNYGRRRNTPPRYGLRVKMTTVPHEAAWASETDEHGNRPNRWGQHVGLYNPEERDHWSANVYQTLSKSPAEGQVVIVPLRQLETDATKTKSLEERLEAAAKREEAEKAQRLQRSANRLESAQLVGAALGRTGLTTHWNDSEITFTLHPDDLAGLRQLLAEGCVIEVSVHLDDEKQLRRMSP